MFMIQEPPERRQALRTLLDRCLDVENYAVTLYHRLSRQVPDTDLTRFFSAMAMEEKGHVAYWKALIRL